MTTIENTTVEEPQHYIFPEIPPLADVCSPTEAIQRWLPELTLYLVTPSSELEKKGLHWNNFPTTGVIIEKLCGEIIAFERAFHVAKEEDPLHIAVFTEDDGCHEMWLSPECSVSILV